MDKSGIFVGSTVASISVFIIFSIFFIIPDEPDEMTIQMQNQIEEVQSELSEMIIEADSGGGMVSVKVNGKQELLELTIEILYQIHMQNNLKLILVLEELSFREDGENHNLFT